MALVSLVAWLLLGGCGSVYGQLLEEDCGVASVMQAMVAGGEDAALGTTPWMAHLYANGQFVCGGSLINHRFVLTAAHCIQPDSVVPIGVRLGEYDTRTVEDCRQGECAPPPTDHAVVNVYRHAFYTSVEYYDIALLKMQQSVAYTANIRPICILLDTTVQQRIDSLREYTLTGWGLMWGGQRASVLQTVNLTQIDRYTCARHGYRIDHTHICAGDFRRHACVGDSGGPLGATVLYDGQPRYIQFGIVSFGRKPCNGVSVFTNVLAYTPLIQRVLQATQS
ncbi:GL10743 [Drosophila persimilis]|uniref:GL10743 n=1 Tax=Drosophila persimilis TaxID=7234 RepID=B4GAA0_DROPE|nr:GL10743 [Drosophila persimilis]